MKILILILALTASSAWAQDALVWGGPGACTDGCIEAAVHVTKLAGLDPIIVTPENFDPSLFVKAKVWVQPGGKSATAAGALGAANRAILKKFIADGGGYVGFCAGAYMTTPMVGRTSVPGLGIIDAQTKPYRGSRGYTATVKLNTPDGIRYQYWQGGPWFKLTTSQLSKIQVTSRYASNKSVNGVDAVYGKGRVSVTGTHPEAPQWWYDDEEISDPDGTDNHVAVSMIKWAARN